MNTLRLLICIFYFLRPQQAHADFLGFSLDSAKANVPCIKCPKAPKAGSGGSCSELTEEQKKAAENRLKEILGGNSPAPNDFSDNCTTSSGKSAQDIINTLGLDQFQLGSTGRTVENFNGVWNSDGTGRFTASLTARDRTRTDNKELAHRTDVEVRLCCENGEPKICYINDPNGALTGRTDVFYSPTITYKGDNLISDGSATNSVTISGGSSQSSTSSSSNCSSGTNCITGANCAAGGNLTITSSFPSNCSSAACTVTMRINGTPTTASVNFTVASGVGTATSSGHSSSDTLLIQSVSCPGLTETPGSATTTCP